ncbi:hypothetical protein FSP39_007021 [Pinctada imbricata]|uniref:YHYH domain-containing protein n=1 Tax=Pinctada imbricata TaxID=66713 RepID=A0AA88Y8E6_PINIB|nr:hypothetical protein FSP39_007021 [Pinctada imbricata]
MTIGGILLTATSLICISLKFTTALTDVEIGKFGVSGNFSGASVSVETNSANHTIRASGIPDHETQTFNNNYPTAQNYVITIPKTPTHATVTGCLSLGAIGITRTGVAIYNPLTGGLDNAVEGATQEQFDSCDGHASPGGAYHYHKLPDSCLYRGEVDEFIGVAVDGFPIYGPRISETDEISEDELDICHGKYVNGAYRYYVTKIFPYFMGCFKGVVINERTVTQYDCSANTSRWDRQSFNHAFYLCHCETTGGGGGGGGGGQMRPECRPENPNPPSDCPDCSDPNPPRHCPPMSSTHPNSMMSSASRMPTSSNVRVTGPSVTGPVDTASYGCRISIWLIIGVASLLFFV